LATGQSSPQIGERVERGLLCRLGGAEAAGVREAIDLGLIGARNRKCGARNGPVFLASMGIEQFLQIFLAPIQPPRQLAERSAGQHSGRNRSVFQKALLAHIAVPLRNRIGGKRFGEFCRQRRQLRVRPWPLSGIGRRGAVCGQRGRGQSCRPSEQIATSGRRQTSSGCRNWRFRHSIAQGSLHRFIPRNCAMVNKRSLGNLTITGPQIRAARGFLRWTAKELAKRTKLGIMTIRRAEAIEGPVQITTANAETIRRTLEAAGVEFTNGKAPGVRLKTNR